MITLHRFILIGLAVTVVLVTLGVAGTVLAQTDPPTLGDGDWTVRDTTVIRDWDVIMLRGNLLVTDGGTLELINSTLLFVILDPGDHGIRVERGSTLKVLDGATVGSWRPNMPITFVVEAGCSLEIRDSYIEEVGISAYGNPPTWRLIALYVGTSDAVIEDSTFTGGLIGLFFDEGVIAPIVRNCTFENFYGIISYGVGIEDCTFKNINTFGIVFHGGDTGYATRCTFDSVFGSSISVGYEYFEPYSLHTAEAVISDSTFLRSNRAIRVLDQSSAVISDCTIDDMEREGIVVGWNSNVELFDSSINNTFNAIVTARSSHLDWTVSTSAFVRGGNVWMTGNITLLEDSTLVMTDFRNLTMRSTTTNPLWINLHAGSTLSLIRGSVNIPPSTAIPETSIPIKLGPDQSDVRGALHLDEVLVLDLMDGYHIRELRAVNSTIPIGKTSVEWLYLEDCVLAQDLRASVTELTLGMTNGSTDCYLIDCRLEGIDRIPTGGPWLVVRSTTVHSFDFLYDLEEMIGKGAVLLVGGGSGPAQFEIWWTARTHVMWQNHLPIVGVEVEVVTQTSESYTSMTDDKGSTKEVRILTEVLTGASGYSSHLPLVFTVNVSGLVESTSVDTVDSPIIVDLLVVDLVPPMLVLDVPDDVATNTTNFTLSGRVIDDHSGVAFLEVALLPADYIRVPVDTTTGRFEHSIVLRKGYQTIAVRGYDSVGNRRVKVVETFFSTAPPYVNIDEPDNESWVNSNLTFVMGVTEEGATVELQGRVAEAVNGSFRIPAYLVEGPNLLTVNATSRAGNHNSTQVLVYLDTKVPSFEVFDPAHSPFYTQIRSHRIRGLVEVGAEVFVNGVPVDVDASGTFTTNQVNLNEGSTKITIWAVDAAGNMNVTEIVYVLDSLPPSLIVLIADQDATLYTGDDVFRTSGETVDLTIITDEDTQLTLNGENITLDSSQVTLEYPLVEGSQTIIVSVMDLAGNSLQFDPINVEVDWVPPTLSLDTSMPGDTEETLINLKGYTEPNCTVTVNGGRVSVDGSGSFVRNFLLNEGDNHLVIVSTDQYGQSTTLVYDVTMIAPEPEPWPDAPSLLPLMLGITIAILVVEVIALQLYWRRKRALEA
jgi:hypothetical protein